MIDVTVKSGEIPNLTFAKSLWSLNMYGGYITAADFFAFTLKIPSLTEITVEKVYFELEGGKLKLPTRRQKKLMKPNVKVKYVTVKESGVTAAFFFLLLKKFPAVTSLDLTQNLLESLDTTSFEQEKFRNSLTQVESLTLVLCRISEKLPVIFEIFPELKVLNLSKNKLDEKTFQTIASYGNKNQLKILDVSANSMMTAQSFKILLLNHLGLKYINIRANGDVRNFYEGLNGLCEQRKNAELIVFTYAVNTAKFCSIDCITCQRERDDYSALLGAL